MNLSLLIILPLITAMAILFVKGLKQVRMVAFIGAAAQLILCLALLYFYYQERTKGSAADFLFDSAYTWYEPLGITYHVGVDGISIAMILLTAFVVVAGVLVSWKMEKMNKELFFFLEIAVIPKFLLIGIWGSGKKEYSAMKLALMLMGGSALVFVGLAGLYFNTNVNGVHSFDLVAIAHQGI